MYQNLKNTNLLDNYLSQFINEIIYKLKIKLFNQRDWAQLSNWATQMYPYKMQYLLERFEDSMDKISKNVNVIDDNKLMLF